MTPEEVLETQFGGPETGIFTDGSCEPNPGPGGWGWVWVEKGEILAQGHGREPDTCNLKYFYVFLFRASVIPIFRSSASQDYNLLSFPIH